MDEWMAEDIPTPDNARYSLYILLTTARGIEEASRREAQ